MAPKTTEAVSFQDKGLNLKDQEIWLVQVPPDFEASKASVKSEQEVEYNGTSYSLLTNGAQLPDCNVLIAPGNDSKLISTSIKPRGVLSLTKKVSLPKVDYEKVRSPKPLVPQKENIRMRHYPTGYGPDSFGISEGASQPKKHSLEGAVPEAKKRKSKTSPEAQSEDKKSKDRSEKKDKKKDKKDKKEKSSSKKDKRKE